MDDLISKPIEKDVHDKLKNSSSTLKCKQSNLLFLSFVKSSLLDVSYLLCFNLLIIIALICMLFTFVYHVRNYKIVNFN